IYLDPGVEGAATLAVDGLMGGQRVGAGSTTLQIVAGAHERASVTLRPFGVDGGGPTDDLTTPRFDLAGADLGAVASCPGASTFCDNFEGETLAFAKWNGSMNGANASVALNNTHPFLSGSTSVEITSTGGMWVLHKTLPPASGFLAMRFYAYVSSTPSDTTT